MNILLTGSGGREHALAWKLQQSPKCEKLFCAPGNAGIAKLAECIDLNVSDHPAVIGFCQKNNIDLVVVGPEAPLVAGLADDLKAAGTRVFGPVKAAAMLEGSKGFTKDICAKYNIPTAAYGRFSNEADALAYLAEQPVPIVVKADGLAAGKGVIVAETRKQAQKAVKDIFSGLFGDAGAEVVIEECLVGEEASFFAICDGERAVSLATAQDHKRVGVGDTGPNTGGMGAYSPAPVMTDAMVKRVEDEIINPTIKAMKDMGSPFCGVLFAGLMITDKGPELIEYNVRFGDPECQVLMMRMEDDLVELLSAAADGNLGNRQTKWKKLHAMTIVMAAKGYPGSYDKGSVIGNLENAGRPDNIEIFHAGTAQKGDDIIAIGGRVLNVTGLGCTICEARDNAYAAVENINWPGGFYRNDIGWRALEREKTDGG